MTIPHDLLAEESVLGAMLLSNAAIDAVSHTLSASDFYKPSHGHCYQAMLEIRKTGTSVDAITLSNFLAGSKTLESIGGTATLMRWMAEVPSITAARHYAEIIMSYALRRRLLMEAKELIEQTQDLNIPIEQVLETHKLMLGSIGNAHIAGEPDDIAVEEFVETHQPDVTSPWVIHGLLRKQHKMMLVGGEGSGKALDINTEIRTTTGWKTMETIVVGDQVFGPDGLPCNVIATTGIMFGRPCYEIKFSTGESIIADANHQWCVVDYNARQSHRDEYQILTTHQMSLETRARNGSSNYSIGIASPLIQNEMKLSIDPYLLGYWLADGSATSCDISIKDESVIEDFLALGYDIKRSGADQNHYRITGRVKWDRSHSFESALKAIGVFGNKHIPTEYLLASNQQRLSLLQGIMDADGYITPLDNNRGYKRRTAQCEFTSQNEILAHNVFDLIISLGIKATIRSSFLEGVRRWRVVFNTDQPIFRLDRKLQHLTSLATQRSLNRYIVSIEPVASTPVKCIEVDHPSHCFLASRALITTHNSWLLRFVAICAAYGIQPFRHTRTAPVRTLLVDCENPEDALHESFERILRQTMEYNPQEETCNRFWWRPSGINLRNRVDLAELENVIAIRRPELVCLGPLYAAFENSTKDFGWETAAREVQSALKVLMVRYQFGLIIEDHAPQADSTGKRHMRPYGSSFWRRWPDIGIGMEPVDGSDDVFELRRWRGDRVPTDWPKIIERGDKSGSPWPFVGKW